MTVVSKWSESLPLTNHDAIAGVPPGPFCQTLRSGNGFAPLPASPLKRRFPGGAKVAGGRVGFPLRDSCSGEATEASSSYGHHPAAMAEGKRVNGFGVLLHVHFKDFENNFWPACKLAAHFTQSAFADLIQIPVDIVHRTFDCSQGHSA